MARTEYVHGLKTSNSQKYFERARKILPGGSNSNSHIFPTFEPYPIAFAKGKGSHVWDIDGNEYIDYNLSMGPLILGHCHPKLMAAVRAQLEKGTMFAMPCELELEAAQLVQDAVPNAEMMRFSNSGAEATMSAIRFARAFTGKDKIVKFEGAYHGGYDYVLTNTVGVGGHLGSEISPYKLPASWGIPEDSLKNTIVIPWNNPEVLEETLRRHAHELAAVISEPVLANIGTVPPREGYLRKMEKLCRDNGVLFILDEVMTGFRMAYGGAQEYYGLKPDLATFSKALGAGFPVSAITGRKEIMELVGGGKVAHFGTYNGNPICMAAVVATLTELGSKGGEAYKKMTRHTNRLKGGLKDALNDAHVSGVVQGVPGLFQIYFNKGNSIKNYRDYFACDGDMFTRFHKEMLKRGVYFHPRQFLHFFTSTVLTNDDVEKTASAASAAIRAISRA